MKYFLKKHYPQIILIAVLSVAFGAAVFAMPPTSPYKPGETDQPNCKDTDTNCYVTEGLSIGDTIGNNPVENEPLYTDSNGDLQNLPYAFPTSDGTSGDYLAINGMGALAWASPTVQTVQVSLTPAQLLALNSNPITLVPAQGPGTLIVPIAATANYTFGTTPYSTATLIIGAGSFNKLFTDSTSLADTQNSIRVFQPFTGLSAGTASLNSPLVLNGAPSGGDGSLVVTVSYIVQTPYP